MKILHFIPSLSKGGAEGFLFRLLKQFENVSEADSKIYVLTLLKDNYYENFLDNKKIIFVKLNFSNKYQLFFNIVKIFNIINSIKPDVIQTWMYHCNFIGGILAKIIGVNKIIWSVRHSNLILFKSKLTTILIDFLLIPLSYVIPTKIVYCSSFSKNIHENKFYNSKISQIIFNGFFPNDFQINPDIKKIFLKKNKLEKNHLIIGAVGRFNKQKNHDFLFKFINLFKNKKNFTLILAGKEMDNSNKKIVKLLKKFNILDNVKLIGFQNDLNYVYNLSDIIISTSNYGESFPNVLAEAMLCGTFCISYNIGESKNIVNNCGVVFDEFEIKNLYNIIKSNLDKVFDTTQKNKRRMHIIKNYNIKKIYKDYHNLWFEI